MQLVIMECQVDTLSYLSSFSSHVAQGVNIDVSRCNMAVEFLLSVAAEQVFCHFLLPIQK